MKRQIVYYGALPQDTDLLNTQKNSYLALSKLAAAILGSNTIFHGLAATPGSGLNVSIAAGQVFSLQNVDNATYGSLASDTSHQILKQGINLDATTLSVPAPTTAGQSINYLVQAQFQEVDGGSQVLPYYNSANPTVALSGQNNNGQAQATYRDNIVALQVKAGTAAATGSQTTPAADGGGWVGLYQVTVNYGDTSIAQAAISTVSGAPFLTNQLYNFANGLTVGGALTGTSATFSGALRAASLDYTPIGQNSPAAATFTRITGNNGSAGGVFFSNTYQNGYTVLIAGTTQGADPAISLYGSTAASYAKQAFFDADKITFRSASQASTYGTLDGNGLNGIPIGQTTPAKGTFASGSIIKGAATGALDFQVLHGNGNRALEVLTYSDGSVGASLRDNALNQAVQLGAGGTSGNNYFKQNIVAPGGLDNCPIGQTTAAAGSFTALIASGIVTGSSAGSQFKAHVDGTNANDFGMWGSGTGVCFGSWDGTKGLKYTQDNNTYQLLGANGSSFTPIGNGYMYLGNASYRWATVYSGGGDFSGSVNIQGAQYSADANYTYITTPSGNVGVSFYNNNKSALVPAIAANGTSGNQVVNFSQFGNNKAASGYQKLPSGLIIQWGVVSMSYTASSPGSTSTINLPIAFPTACQSVTGNLNYNTYVGGVFVINTYATSASQITLTMDPATGSEPAGTFNVYWMAIGY